MCCCACHQKPRFISGREAPLPPVAPLGQQLDKVQKQVDDVEVEADAGGHVLVHAVLLHDQGRVVQDEGAEQHGPERRVHERRPPAEDGVEEAPAEHDHQPPEQEAPHEREVLLGTVHVDGQRGKDGQGEARRPHQHIRQTGGLVQGADDPHYDRLADGEQEEEDGVGGVLVLEPPARQGDHDDHGADEGPPQEPPGVPQQERPRRGMPGAEAGDGGREGELHAQDGVDFAQEGVPEVGVGGVLGTLVLGGAGPGLDIRVVLGIVFVRRSSQPLGALLGTSSRLVVGIVRRLCVHLC